MRVTQELVTVLADPLAGEINIVLAGFRIALSADEGAQLAHALAAGLERLLASNANPPPEAWTVRRATPEDTANRPLSEAETMQQRARALIRATMREKGLSLSEEKSE